MIIDKCNPVLVSLSAADWHWAMHIGENAEERALGASGRPCMGRPGELPVYTILTEVIRSSLGDAIWYAGDRARLKELPDG